MRFALLALICFTLIPANTFADPKRADWKDAVFYEIFVRSFHDSNGDGIGDLDGIRAKLNYLNSNDAKSIGVGGIWLTPIFKSNSYHGYDATDYTGIDPAYGNSESFAKFIA